LWSQTLLQKPAVLMVVAYHPQQSYEKAKAMLMRPKRC